MSTVYEIAAERVLAELAKGAAPWHRPWASPDGPGNLASGRPYRGLNVFLLSSSDFWVSFKQAQELGGCVRKGEKSAPCFFFKWMDRKTAGPVEPGEVDARGQVPVLRYYAVFSPDQVDAAPDSRFSKLLAERRNVAPRVFNPIADAENILASYPNGPAVSYGGGRAFYRPSTDSVTVPARESFETPQHFYSTLFHELAHSTGHESRLARIKDHDAFGSHGYGREELVAEMSAAMLCHVAGFLESTVRESAAYLDGWRRAIRQDMHAVVIAAAQAQKAADWIRGLKAVESAAA